MAGDIANPRIWINADVYIAPVGSTGPTDISTALNAAFEPIGLLSQDDGIVESRSEDKTEHFAYGNILVRVTKQKQKRTITVTALEDLPVVWDLLNPGSEAVTNTGITTRTVYTPNTPNPKAMVLVNTDGDVNRRLYIPTCEVNDVGDRQINDNAMATAALTFDIYPDGEGVLYYEITDDPQADVGS